MAEYFDIDLMKTYGLDCDDRQVAECGKIFNAAKTDLETENIPYPDYTFDLRVCNQVLEHLKNFERALSEIIRVAGNRGYIILGIGDV